MSKIFEILNSGKGEIADLVRPVMAVETKEVPAKGTGNNGQAGGSVKTSAPEATAAVPPAKAPTVAQVRTLNLRVPAPSPLLPFEEGQWQPSEQYRILRTKIVQNPKQPHVIVISSPAAGDGKSVSAINTAAALSLKSEGQVLLVDADFRRSAIHALLGLPESPGLADVLKGTCTLEEAVIRTQEFPKLFVMSAGLPGVNPVELLDSAQWKALCARLREMFRYVVMDSPPVGAVADYDLILAVCDGVILVVRPDHTNRKLCQRALETVPKAKCLGVLLNCVPEWPLAKRTGSYHYYNYSDRKTNHGSNREASA